jgi:ribosomal protein L11 methyltransferase
MDYIEIIIQTASAETREILVSLLAEENFESFAETEDELQAFISVSNYVPGIVQEICHRFGLNFTEKQIPGQNWNAEWEKNFEPVLIAESCYIRAPFHAPRHGYLYEIIIEPKMSFGTAHHETTAMMIEEMLKMDIQGKKVLDMGCGTGILAILADKMGASAVDAIDNDEWAFLNAVENMEKNHANAVKVKKGDVGTAGEDYDIVLANINRNVLVEHLPEYAKRIKKGDLLLSGFYEEDLEVIRQAAESNAFAFDFYVIKNQWVAARFTK